SINVVLPLPENPAKPNTCMGRSSKLEDDNARVALPQSACLEAAKAFSRKQHDQPRGPDAPAASFSAACSCTSSASERTTQSGCAVAGGVAPLPALPALRSTQTVARPSRFAGT